MGTDNAGRPEPGKRQWAATFGTPERPRATPAATPAATALHKNFCNSVAGLRRDLVRSITYLRAIYDRKVYRALGYESIYRYAADAAQLTENQCRAFLKIGAQLSTLPAMREALAAGSISWTKASHIAAVATRENEVELLDLARTVSAEQLRSRSTPSAGPAVPPALPPASPAVSDAASPPAPQASTPGPASAPAPSHPPAQPADTPCYVSFKFTPEQYEVWTRLRAAEPGSSKEEQLLNALAQPRQGDAKTAPPPHYLVILHECPACGRARLRNNRGEFEAPKALIEAAHCDSVVEDADAKRRQSIPPRIRRAVLQRDGYRCQAANCVNTQFLEIHHRVPAACGGRSTPENLVTLCARCHRALHERETALRTAARDPVA